MWYNPWMNSLYAHDIYAVLVDDQEQCNAMEREVSGRLDTQDLYSGIASKMRDSLQPAINSHGCEALLFSPLHYHPLNVLISCDQPVRPSFIICSKWDDTHAEINENVLVEITRPSQKQLHKRTYACPALWTPFNGTCFQMKPFKS